MQGISVVVCCYNSASRLPETLKHLAKQNFDRVLNFEIIIVDNASNDDTVGIARKVWDEQKISNIDFRVLDQPIPGKSFALDLGVEQAKYEYIIICDDDNWLAEDYVMNAYEILESDDMIGVAGGQGIIATNTQLPGWWEDFKHGYAIGKQGDTTGDITIRKFIWGAGMVTRRSIFLSAFSAKYPALLTCRKGSNLSSGGDSEFCMRIILMGYKLNYCESLHFNHYISKERLTESYRDRLFCGFKESQEVLKEYNIQISYLYKSQYKKFKILIKSILRLILIELNLSKKYTKEDQLNWIYRITGISLGEINNNVKIVSDFARYQKN
jgi:glycosyltransferase involved in cell wall biosynthesis